MATRAKAVKIRTRADALREAEKRWGNFGAVKSSRCTLWDMRLRERGFHGPLQPGCTCSAHGRECPGGQPEKRVGRIELGIMFSVKGCAATWDEAFRLADKEDGRAA